METRGGYKFLSLTRFSYLFDKIDGLKTVLINSLENDFGISKEIFVNFYDSLCDLENELRISHKADGKL